MGKKPTVTLADGSEVLAHYPGPNDHYPSTGDEATDSRLVNSGMLVWVNVFLVGQFNRYVLLDDIEQNPGEVARKVQSLTKTPINYFVLHFGKGLAQGSGPGGNVSANPAHRQAAFLLWGNEHFAHYFPNLPKTAATFSNLVSNGNIKGFYDKGLCTSSGTDIGTCFAP